MPKGLKWSKAMVRKVSSSEVYGEPNGRLALRCPSYTMGTMSRDQNMVSRTKITFAFMDLAINFC
jgi:hypothetical protein